MFRMFLSIFCNIEAADLLNINNSEGLMKYLSVLVLFVQTESEMKRHMKYTNYRGHGDFVMMN